MDKYPWILESDEIIGLRNWQMPVEQARRLSKWTHGFRHMRRHFFILTSGSSATSDSGFKWVALSKDAVLASARAANQHLAASTHKDTWLHCLPTFHVGGLGISARAHVSGARVVWMNGPWSPAGFAKLALYRKATLASLVPTQVHDLVEANLASPPTLRAIIVGGAALSESVYFRARELGWPVLPSYGMTETASQIATASLDSLAVNPTEYPALEILPHLDATTDENSRLRIRGESLLTGYIQLDDHGVPAFNDPKDADGWFTTDDFGEVNGRILDVKGRLSDRIKIGGEIVNLAYLRKVLEEISKGLSIALVPIPDKRLESVIALCAERTVSDEHVAKVKLRFNRRVMPFERIRAVKRVERIPRTDLGKIKWAELAWLAQEP